MKPTYDEVHSALLTLNKTGAVGVPYVTQTDQGDTVHVELWDTLMHFDFNLDDELIQVREDGE